MAKGEMKALVADLRGVLAEALSRFDEPSLRRLRGELQVVARWLADHKEAGRARFAEAALRAVTRLYEFSAEIRGFASSRRFAERASFFDLGAIGVLAVENVITAERVTPMRLLMSGLSEGLMFLASRQYIRGGDAVLEATYQAQGVAVQDELWALAMDFREADGLVPLREARASIDEVFQKLEDPAVPVATKIAVLHQLSALVAVVRCVRLLEALYGRS